MQQVRTFQRAADMVLGSIKWLAIASGLGLPAKISRSETASELDVAGFELESRPANQHPAPPACTQLRPSDAR